MISQARSQLLPAMQWRMALFCWWCVLVAVPLGTGGLQGGAGDRPQPIINKPEEGDGNGDGKDTNTGDKDGEGGDGKGQNGVENDAIEGNGVKSVQTTAIDSGNDGGEGKSQTGVKTDAQTAVENSGDVESNKGVGKGGGEGEGKGLNSGDVESSQGGDGNGQTDADTDAKTIVENSGVGESSKDGGDSQVVKTVDTDAQEDAVKEGGDGGDSQVVTPVENGKDGDVKVTDAKEGKDVNAVKTTAVDSGNTGDITAQTTGDNSAKDVTNGDTTPLSDKLNKEETDLTEGTGKVESSQGDGIGQNGVESDANDGKGVNAMQTTGETTALDSGSSVPDVTRIEQVEKAEMENTIKDNGDRGDITNDLVNETNAQNVQDAHMEDSQGSQGSQDVDADTLAVQNNGDGQSGSLQGENQNSDTMLAAQDNTNGDARTPGKGWQAVRKNLQEGKLRSSNASLTGENTDTTPGRGWQAVRRNLQEGKLRSSNASLTGQTTDTTLAVQDGTLGTSQGGDGMQEAELESTGPPDPPQALCTISGNSTMDAAQMLGKLKRCTQALIRYGQTTEEASESSKDANINYVKEFMNLNQQLQELRKNRELKDAFVQDNQEAYEALYKKLKDTDERILELGQ